MEEMKKKKKITFLARIDRAAEESKGCRVKSFEGMDGDIGEFVARHSGSWRGIRTYHEQLTHHVHCEVSF